MSEKKISGLQSSLLTMFQWFHNFCVEHELRYYMLGGTMLGAARHCGFIPWDDDIDVGMPRKDYEKFIEICGDSLINNFYIESIKSKNPDFFYGFCKIYDTRTTLVENTRYKIKRGIFIDVFPLDGAGDSLEDAKKTHESVSAKIKLLVMKTYGFRKDRKWYKNIAVLLGRMIPEFVVNSKKLMLNIDRRCQEHDYDGCKFTCNYFGAWGIKEVIPYDVMGNPTLYDFEEMKAYGVENADAYLTCLYGDWRKLPPKEKQVTHHDYLSINLDEPYM